ncbi:phiSA1p31-related protein [Streptomyces sp. NRRL F-5630]|uniref:phiSA1p31-related protein n=1 Tax=Streptomyces sp. NRRL F-5630 TaxID=1463864 RepID=UPI0004CB439A|nr:phiSA1p31-related protein [Streptomyces sp. NRRL F-5630]
MDEKTFKVGDKVTNEVSGPGEVVFGPFQGVAGAGMYLVKDEGSPVHWMLSARSIAPLPAFKVGDRVTAYGTPSVIVGGPYDEAGKRPVWVVRTEDGTLFFPNEQRVRPAPADEPALVPVGTRVRVDRARYAEASHGRTGVVTSNTETWEPYEGGPHPYEVDLDDGGTFYAAEVTPIDDKPAAGFEYNGVVYEYGALYQGRDGDLFRFRPEISDDGTGTPQGQLAYGTEDDGCPWHWSLAETVSGYGPLTKK